MSNIPQVLQKELEILEPNATFTASLPKIESSKGKRYFAKIGSISERDQYVGEAESLKEINNAAPGIAPRVFVYGDTDGKPYFLSEYLDYGYLTNKASGTLAKRLATELHQYKSTKGFGFQAPTYCGATRQDNGWYETWEVCYSAMMGALLAKLSQRGTFRELVDKGNEVRRRVIPYLLGSIHVDPVLLHGDLWSGNTGADDSTGEPVIFDPSSYYGHNEADLAIARMFGGFPASFFETYHAYFPKTEPVDQYEQRADLYELYHYFNHTVLFGGAYAGSAMQKMDVLLKRCPSEKASQIEVME